MKKNFLKISIVLLAITMASCLSDEKYAIDPSNSYNLIEFMDPSVPSSPAGSIYPAWTATTEVQETFTFEQTISYSGPKSNDHDIELLIEVDPSVLEEYNTQMEDDLDEDTFEMMPASYYDFEPLTVILPKGQKKVTFEITVFPLEFDLSRSFALPLRITSASHGVLSQNFSAAVFNVVVKNIYDGVYKIAQATVNRYNGAGVLESPSSLGGVYPANEIEIDFATVNGTTTRIDLLWKDESGVGGIDDLEIKVLEGAAPAGAPVGSKPVDIYSTGLANLGEIPGRLNYYDPATRTFFLNFDWTGSSGKREVIDGKFVWDHVR